MKSTFILGVAMLLAFSVAGTDAKACTNPPEKNNVDAHKVNGVVLDMDSKKPLKDVNVTAIRQSKKEKVVTTDVNGGYTIIMLKPGTYRLIFEKEGYKKVIKEKVEVKENNLLQINIEMPEFAPISDRGPSAWHFFES
ncbi:MAG: carboxypeptidase regulatory-like domain-containing protein [Terrimonas sp.]|uniref:carboxypeptidase-like regulatory domain-containing protein n=1 Tax=Terrimonas sp. TaxID=1914338 RepID=UPI000A7BC1ED|nr:carboxypeptidase-like regulatory domain-containing protein [Terrimonas sp.]MBN8787609.1 carboxypeptidase regulatory-like domain-containing protein [Terrimonas sp.]